MNFPSTFLRPKKAIQRDIERAILELRSRAKVGLHLGCGGDIIQGLINCDAFHPAAEMAVGATDLSQFADASVDHIETHHMIEHLSFEEARIAFLEWSRVLAPGAYLVVTCPDFESLIKRWRSSSNADNWRNTIKMFYGSQEHEGMFHKSGYSAARLTRMFADAGLTTVFSFTPYPRRPTPSLCVVAQKT
ncbi:MAG TPA: methyltransferase domain-containing protein [Fimbriimonas sp.]|nr:methyltransferase domain-containing protein [Fimbriimonas sp.]